MHAYNLAAYTSHRLLIKYLTEGQNLSGGYLY